MSKLIIISNRLPLQIKVKDKKLEVKPSVGGLATGMKSVHNSNSSVWIGWTGLVKEKIDKQLKPEIDDAVKDAGCIPVDLSQKEVDRFYYGFSNKTIWPLFHYFTEYTHYNKSDWETYVDVNKKYAESCIKNLEKGDKIWIHDYQLLLLPKMIKEKRPDINIGFFLHIPFPSFEVFRILPWRKQLLEGMLGADLIGFHTYDYERHFFSSVRRLLGHEINLNEINLGTRIIKCDSFPMGIDFEKFQRSAILQQQKSIKDRSEIQQELEKHLLMKPDLKLILSIDRLDYTKGIANRLRAFEFFLEKHPEFHKKTTLVMLSVPSRSNVEQYQLMKKEVDELVGRINGKYATINWTPVWYFYRSLPFENLIDLYSTCEVALLTPIRDGMNLVAKEYISAKIDKKGVLILSEMAGAAKEMSEALVINPNNYEEISEALKTALIMPDNEQIRRNQTLQKRLKRYNIDKWAADFMTALEKTNQNEAKFLTEKLKPNIKSELLKKYKDAKRRVLFLDYDGTLVNYKNQPEDAYPDNKLLDILDKLTADSKNELVLISGRDKNTFENWFSEKKYNMIVEHGVWIKKPDKDWKLLEQLNVGWKSTIASIVEFYVDRTPGTFMEEKNYSLVWHYRKADPELGIIRANELKDELTSLIANHNLEIMEGNKVIEIKNSGINKGRAATHFINGDDYDFILGIGDDWTDEYLFEELSTSANTIKVGIKNTKAKYYIENVESVRDLLESFLNEVKTPNTKEPAHELK